ncbi:hypothetical protein HID58_046811 [Brassica napus]|uniref:Uncharacterized protein n=1 Tax=Brassica napus TaxID=3708 RepID=A0ABQ8AXM7_BRANA|nr:hypothetical protein HID58_046811 [Brassica napus]
MYDRTEDRFNALEKRIVMHADAFVASGLYEEQVDPAVASQRSIFAVGMICCDGEGHLNDKSILLQSRVAKRPPKYCKVIPLRAGIDGGTGPGAPLKKDDVQQNPNYLEWKTKALSRSDATNTEVRVMVKHRRHNRLHCCPRDYEHKGMKTLKEITSVARRRSRSHHRRKPWLVSLELKERSPMRSSVPSFRLRPWEQDREALILVAEEETRKSIGGGREAGGEETATRFIPASLYVGSDPEPALDKLLIYQADSASCKHSYYHDLALSPKTLGHTHTSIWPSDPAKIRKGRARRR